MYSEITKFFQFNEIHYLSFKTNSQSANVIKDEERRGQPLFLSPFQFKSLYSWEKLKQVIQVEFYFRYIQHFAMIKPAVIQCRVNCRF